MSDDSDGKKKNQNELKIYALNELYQSISYIQNGGKLIQLYVNPEYTQSLHPKIVDLLEGLKHNTEELAKFQQQILKDVTDQLLFRPSYIEIQRDFMVLMTPPEQPKKQFNDSDNEENQPLKLEEQKIQPSHSVSQKNFVKSKFQILILEKYLGQFSNNRIQESELHYKENSQQNLMFISEKYFNMLYQEMKNEQELKYQKIKLELDGYIKKMQKFLDFADLEFPKIRIYSKRCNDNVDKVLQIQEVHVLRQFKKMQIREIFKFLKLFQQRAASNKQKIRQIAKNYSKFHQRRCLKKWKQNSDLIKSNEDQASIPGVKKQLEKFKLQLQCFDIALKNINILKADKQEITQQLNKKDDGSMLTDFQQYFDSTVQNIIQKQENLINEKLSLNEQTFNNKHKVLIDKFNQMEKEKRREQEIYEQKTRVLERCIQNLEIDNKEIINNINYQNLNILAQDNKEIQIKNVIQSEINKLRSEQLENKQRLDQILQNFNELIPELLKQQKTILVPQSKSVNVETETRNTNSRENPKIQDQIPICQKDQVKKTMVTEAATVRTQKSNIADIFDSLSQGNIEENKIQNSLQVEEEAFIKTLQLEQYEKYQQLKKQSDLNVNQSQLSQINQGSSRGTSKFLIKSKYEGIDKFADIFVFQNDKQLGTPIISDQKEKKGKKIIDEINEVENNSDEVDKDAYKTSRNMSQPKQRYNKGQYIEKTNFMQKRLSNKSPHIVNIRPFPDRNQDTIATQEYRNLIQLRNQSFFGDGQNQLDKIRDSINQKIKNTLKFGGGIDQFKKMQDEAFYGYDPTPKRNYNFNSKDFQNIKRSFIGDSTTRDYSISK